LIQNISRGELEAVEHLTPLAQLRIPKISTFFSTFA
jgi:hypothetical protein